MAARRVRIGNTTLKRIAYGFRMTHLFEKVMYVGIGEWRRSRSRSRGDGLSFASLRIHRMDKYPNRRQAKRKPFHIPQSHMVSLPSMKFQAASCYRPTWVDIDLARLAASSLP
jgi:hypothetical protein